MATTFLLGLVWIGFTRMPPTSMTEQAIQAPAAGFLAPDFSLVSTDGTTVQLSALRGKPVVLNFWATWCGPCRAEMPALEEVWQRYGKGDVIVLGVNQGEGVATVTRYAQDEVGVTFPLLLDSQLEVATRYNVRALPTTFFVDANGRIRDVQIGGPLDQTALLAGVNKALHP